MVGNNFLKIIYLSSFFFYSSSVYKVVLMILAVLSTPDLDYIPIEFISTCFGAKLLRLLNSLQV